MINIDAAYTMEIPINTWTQLSGDIYIYLGPYDNINLNEFTKDEQERMVNWRGLHIWKRIFEQGQRTDTLFSQLDLKTLPGETIMTEEEIKNLKIKLL